MATGIQDFQSFLQSFLGLAAAGTATTALVLVTAFIGVAPPWPSAIVQITAVAQLVALIFAYQRSIGLKKPAMDRVMRTAAVILVIGAVLYLTALSMLVYEVPTTLERAIRGVFCTADATLVYETDCPLLSLVQIGEAQYDPDTLWSPAGLAMSRMALLITWVVTFCGLVTLVGSFVAYQRKRVAARPRAGN